MSNVTSMNHRSIGHDIFYPSDPVELSRLVQGALGSAREVCSLPAALLAPHASYETAADLLGRTYRQAALCEPKHIVILAPLHREKLHEHTPYLLFYPEGASLQAGPVSLPLDKEMLSHMCGESGTITGTNSYFLEEPAIELQLPFIHELFGSVSILPILTGENSSAAAHEAAKLLKLLPREETLFIITSNATGYKRRELAQQEASRLEQLFSAGETGNLLEKLHRKEISMCAAAAAAALEKSGIFTEPWKQVLIEEHDASGQQKETTFMISAFRH